MKLGETLIDKASKACGSDSALAKRMGIYRQDVSNLRLGKRPLSPELAAELADIAGDDAREAAIAAIIERNKGTRKEGVMREILGKALAAGVAAMCLFFYSGDSTWAFVRQTASPVFVGKNPTNGLDKVNTSLIVLLWGFCKRCMSEWTEMASRNLRFPTSLSRVQTV